MRWQLRAVGHPVPKGSWDPVPHARPLVARGEKFYRIRDIGLKPVEAPALAKWNHALALAALEAGRPKEPVLGPVGVDIVFWFTPPKKPKWPFPITRRNGDGDKLKRAVWDAFSHVYYVDDCQIAAGSFQKLYATASEPEGALITIYTIEVRQTDLDWKEIEEVLG